jgi:exopolysaccharide production protein ExoQ
MPPQLALVICIFVILYLFRMDAGRGEGVSHAVWIPFSWMFLAASRFVSQWVRLGTPDFSTEAILDGSPIDRAVFAILIISGLLTLLHRRIAWGKWIADNKWVWLYFAFGLVSIFWSDYPMVALRRLMKASGNLVMALVILSEERPYRALGITLKRLAYILIPLSVLFIKYYPELGRRYHMGMPMFTGVATQKNGLGQICLLSGIYFSWHLIAERMSCVEGWRRMHYSIYAIMLPMTLWLFYMADSATSLGCMGIALGLFLVSRLSIVARHPGRILTILGVGAVLYVGAEALFGISGKLIEMLGRDPTLTTRVPMWEDLLSMVQNPIIGFGYESFWLGARQEMIYEKWGIAFNAHNGYLEMYLHLGGVGVCFLLLWAISGVRNVRKYLSIHYGIAILRLCLIVVVLIYNWTEATFYGINNMWLLLWVAMLIESADERYDRMWRRP